MSTQLNKQIPLKQEWTDDGQLNVHSIWKTIQGEGPYAGVPAIFIRLAGCNLQCPLCDTEYTQGARMMRVDQLMQTLEAAKEGRDINLVVITGGEPFRQRLGPLVKELDRANQLIQIETNGAFYDVEFPHNWVTIVCSPKTNRISLEMAERVDAWKYIIEAGKVEADGLPSCSLGMRSLPFRPAAHVLKRNIYVQPLDDKDEDLNQLNMMTAVNSCNTHGYRLCLQVQKIIGVA